MALYNDIAKVFNKRGYNVVVGNHFDRVQMYLSWYRGSVNDFHYYNIDGANGNSIQIEKKALGMAKTACEDFAGLEFNENSRIVIEDNKDADKFLNDVLEDNDFYENITDCLELSKALGDSYFVEYLSNGKIKIDYINADDAMITDFDNYKIKGLVLIGRRQVGKYYITHLQHCLFRDGKYKVVHEVYRSSTSDSLGKQYNIEKCGIFTEAELNKLKKLVIDQETGQIEVEYSAEFDTKVSFFQRLRPNVKNNFDITSPYGMSRLGNSIDVLKSIDNAYDAYDTEVENGRSRIMVDQTLMKASPRIELSGTNNVSFVKYFSARERVFQAVSGMANNNGGDKIQIYNPTIREAELSNAISNNLSMLGFKFGLGKNMYEFVNGIVQRATATEVKVDDNDKWIKIESDRKITERALRDLAMAILTLGKETGGYKGSIDDIKVKVVFDDSVLIDDEEEYRKAYELVRDGNKPLKLFLTENVGKTEEEANRWIEDLKQEKANDMDLTLSKFAATTDEEEMQQEVVDE